MEREEEKNNDLYPFECLHETFKFRIEFLRNCLKINEGQIIVRIVDKHFCACVGFSWLHGRE